MQTRMDDLRHRLKRRLTALSVAVAMVLAAVADTGRLYTADRLSSGMMTCICQDRYGYIWVGTEYGLNKFDGYRYTTYMHSRKDTTSLTDNDISSLYVDHQGRLWIGCSRGLARYDYEHDTFIRYGCVDGRKPRVNAIAEGRDGTLYLGTSGYGLYTVSGEEQQMHVAQAFNQRHADDFYNHIYVDRQGCVWRGSHQNTLTRYTVGRNKTVNLRDYQSPYGTPQQFVEQPDGRLLIVCQYGILSYDHRSGEISPTDYNLQLLDHNVYINSALRDAAGNLYICTAGTGLMMIPKGSKQMVRVDNSNGHIDLSTADVRQVLEDKNHNLWVLCYNKGLLFMPHQEAAFSEWDFAQQHYVTGGSTSSIAPGEDDDLWCTVQNNGVYRLNSKGRIIAHPQSPAGTQLIYRDRRGQYWLATENVLYRYEPTTGRATAVERFNGNGLNCITDDGQGRLYISVYGQGLCVYDTATGQSELISMQQTERRGGYLCNDWIKSLLLDSRGLLWICTANGTAVMKPDGRVFNSRGWNSILNDTQCFSACETADGNILIGTENGLFLFDWKKNQLHEVPNAEPLHDKMICAMVRDQQGDIWLSTTMGIWHYAARQHRLTGHIGGNGLTNKEYVLGAALHRTDDHVFFGTPNGITTFLPTDINKGNVQPGKVYLTKFTANGKTLNPMKTRFCLPFADNTFTLEFSLLDYKNAENITFQYRINNSSTWSQTGEGVNQIPFNELPPGQYTIEVRAANGGVCSNPSTTLHIVIKKPWYKTFYAYLIYLSILVGFVGLLLFNFERQRRRDLEETKMRFLINATHDIRSPLTLIMGPLEKLKQMVADIPDSQPYIDTIDKNAKRLLLLVNQILDERKIDKHQMKLCCTETDLTDFVRGIFKLYEYNAQQRGINYRLVVDENPGKVWIDRINFDKVVSNLLSNAFKYTFDGGEIVVRLSRYPSSADIQNTAHQRAVIEVIDTGLGFEDDKTERFFERFYQGKNSKDLHIDGTGIGLNLCRAITELHGGHISAANRKDGQRGAVLTVLLPYGTTHLRPEEIAIDEPQAAVTTQAPKHQASRNFRVLIVDDDPEIGAYIKHELGDWYKFDYAPNGREALKKLLTQRYELVISDVMMPEMDGITLLRSIKSNPNISDVPVILLTSKSEISFRLEGLKKGADAFLAKPFSMEELHILIDNLVDNIRRLRGKFSGAQVQQGKVNEVTVKGNDDVLMEKVMKSINQNLSNPDFDVERLTQDVGVSRAQLHRKMKELTGIPASEFIRNLRLEQAARLICEKKINITQVAYAVGFNNQTHFSTVFKKHFGMTPTEYAEHGCPTEQ